MVLASSHYDEEDYFRDYNDYLAARGLPLINQSVRLHGEGVNR